ncbi:hypothetical protein [Methanoculleus sp.]|uniref:hypothetical protein n=1 Tax=Methanoculleus sp. TaxID=90427 RepID=UPI0025E5A5FB|nr:hypothetical protein [Methanoculleus sp.]MCK9319511.1 hypothetical protein [Methanoculleus sp.]
MSNDFDYTYQEREIVNHVQQAVLQAAKIPMEQYWSAIGNLVMWAAHQPAYKFLVISHDGMDGDLIANYYSSREALGQRPSYQRGAIWREDTQEYSFHS